MTSYCVTCGHASQKSDDGLYCTKRHIWMSKYASCSDHTDLILRKREDSRTEQQSKKDTEKSVSVSAFSVEQQFEKEVDQVMSDIKQQIKDFENQLRSLRNRQNSLRSWQEEADEIREYEARREESYDKNRDNLSPEGRRGAEEQRVSNWRRLQEARQKIESNRQGVERERQKLDLMIDSIEKTAPSSMSTELQLARLISEVDRGKGLKFAYRAAKCQPQTSDDSLKLAVYFEQQGRKMEDAISVARQGYLKFPTDKALKEKLVNLLVRHGTTDELLDFLCEVSQKSPEDLSLIKEVAQQLLNGKRQNDAVGFLEKEIKKRPHNMELCDFTVAVLVQIDKIGQIEQLLQGFPDKMRIRHQVVDLLKSAGKTEAAMNYLDAEGKRYPQDAALREYIYGFLVDALSMVKSTPAKLLAIDNLQSRGDKRAIEPLERVFNQETEAHLKLRALQALVSLQKSEAKSSVWKGLTLQDSSYFEIRSYAAQALVDIGDSDMVTALAHVLKAEPNETVRDAIMSTLGKLDTEPRTFWEKLLGRRPWAK